MIEYNTHFDPIQSLIKKHDNGFYYAIHKGKLFNSVFQPIFNEKMKIIGYEALVRITMEGAIINPQQFFDDLEYDVQEDTFYFLLTAKLHLQNFSIFNNGCFLCVNTSPNVFNYLSANDQAIVQLLNRLNYLKINPEQLIYEVTEKYNSNLNATFLGRDVLLSKDIKIAVDDYGSGFFDLDIVSRIEPHVIKIDKSIVQNILSEEGENQIKAIKKLKNKFNFKIIAEGVESEAQFNALKNMRVDYYQGFYLSKPIPTIDLAQM